ncbi:PEP-CTERM sorting domain-containing protein [Aquitalea sp. ASV11]|uniref:PEP-CTERM sorting domain-containing protein n=1 Tax=Aquitalea sp. ASV11 TaxID=2795103 RepID=UPI0018EE4441|nr:PEP-CTERM sorting domain-containing protein [Aquitalea sp. ASV11]
MKIASLLVSAALLASPLAHANLVQNGDFSQGWTDWSLTRAAFGTDIYLPGNNTIGFGAVSPPYMDTISQTLATTAGSSYALTFSFWNGNYNNNQLNALINGHIAESFSNVNAGIGYTPSQYVFTATSNSTVLSFSGYNVPSWTYLSNVAVNQVSPVPEPETYALMGMGLLAITLKLRKKKQGQSSAALSV